MCRVRSECRNDLSARERGRVPGPPPDRAERLLSSIQGSIPNQLCYYHHHHTKLY